MLKKVTPVKWRQGYAVHRRKKRLDSLGEVQVWYDMDTPDEMIADGDENGVCWQEVGSWREDSVMTSGSRIGRHGEGERSAIQGVLYGSLEVMPFDRFVIRGKVYELRRVQEWQNHRMLTLKSL